MSAVVCRKVVKRFCAFNTLRKFASVTAMPLGDNTVSEEHIKGGRPPRINKDHLDNAGSLPVSGSNKIMILMMECSPTSSKMQNP